MQIDITKLLINSVSSINIADDVVIPSDYLTNTLIDKLSNVKFKGKASLDEENNITIIGIITGEMELKDDITLAPVSVSFSSDIEETLPADVNKLDITNILWQNILTEIPSKVRSTEEDIELKGDGWRLISEDVYNEERKSNQNPFANLAELLETKEEK